MVSDEHKASWEETVNNVRINELTVFDGMFIPRKLLLATLSVFKRVGAEST